MRGDSLEAEHKKVDWNLWLCTRSWSIGILISYLWKCLLVFVPAFDFVFSFFVRSPVTFVVDLMAFFMFVLCCFVHWKKKCLNRSMTSLAEVLKCETTKRNHPFAVRFYMYSGFLAVSFHFSLLAFSFYCWIGQYYIFGSLAWCFRF